ncbi:hypothetical protein MY526_15810 [Geodermatophilus sp. CPCC 205761]
MLAGPQDEVLQAVGHPLLLGPLVTLDAHLIRVGLQLPVDRRRGRQRQVDGHRRGAVAAVVQPDTPPADRGHQLACRGLGVPAQHDPPGTVAELRRGLAAQQTQHVRLDLGAQAVVRDRADDRDHLAGMGRAQDPAGQQVQRHREALVEHQGLGELHRRGHGADPQRRCHLVDRPLAHLGEHCRPSRAGGC